MRVCRCTGEENVCECVVARVRVPMVDGQGACVPLFPHSSRRTAARRPTETRQTQTSKRTTCGRGHANTSAVHMNACTHRARSEDIRGTYRGTHTRQHVQQSAWVQLAMSPWATHIVSQQMAPCMLFTAALMAEQENTSVPMCDTKTDTCVATLVPKVRAMF